MNNIWDTIKSWTPAIALFIIVGALIYVVSITFTRITQLQGPTETTLPILAIAGVVVLVLMLTIVTAVFWWLGLADNTQALGLPEGSIRAVIALTLIVLFAILAIYLYANVSAGGQLNTIQNLTVAERDQFLKDHSGRQEISNLTW